METIHISEEEAARVGAEIVIEPAPVAIVSPAELPRRSLSELIAIVEARTKERGYAAVMDADFAADMEEIIANRKPRDTSAWD